MQTSVRVLVGVLGAISLYAFGPSAQAMEVIRLSSGQTVQAPPTKQMSCDQLAAKLFEIDDTGYRGVSPHPINPRDQALLDYEMKVADARFRRCAQRTLESVPAAGAAVRTED